MIPVTNLIAFQQNRTASKALIQIIRIYGKVFACNEEGKNGWLNQPGRDL